jgi:hypothetical protein
MDEMDAEDAYWCDEQQAPVAADARRQEKPAREILLGKTTNVI